MSVLQPPIAAAATPLFARSSDARTDVTESRGADVIEFPVTPSRRAAAAEPMSKQKRLLKIAGLAVDALELSLEEMAAAAMPDLIAKHGGSSSRSALVF